MNFDVSRCIHFGAECVRKILPIVYMQNPITKGVLQRYNAAKDLIVDIELFTRDSSLENPSVVNLQEKIET